MRYCCLSFKERLAIPACESSEELLAGAGKHGKATLTDAQRVIDEMIEYGVEPDMGTYSQLLLTVASLANSGR